MRPDLATIADVELLPLIAAGDPAAIGILYDRYAGTLVALALRVVRDRTEAEDVLHDAFVLVSERAHHYTPERGTVTAWLVTLVRNLSIDRVRRRDRRGAIAREILAHEPIAPTARLDPESHALDAAEVARMRRALDTLPPAQRATLELSFFSGLSYPEIAEQENLPLGTIKSRAARALLALRKALEAGEVTRG
ncbi:MAG TPA: sigma-70 family RNA polymerase sigma factor [Polyangiaceae bacterium]|jgi:RNA polymerase sigma-70 factor (ECF subfamily)